MQWLRKLFFSYSYNAETTASRNFDECKDVQNVFNINNGQKLPVKQNIKGILGRNDREMTIKNNEQKDR